MSVRNQVLLRKASFVADQVGDGQLQSQYTDFRYIAPGALNCNCSSFVAYMFELADLAHAYREVHTYFEDRYEKEGYEKPYDPGIPNSPEYYHFFRDLQNGSMTSNIWQGVPLECIMPGDILAYIHPGSKNEHYHTFIVKRVIQRDGRLYLNIIDSTKIPHGKTDSRYQSKRTGVGEGDIEIILRDEDGNSKLIWKPDNPKPLTRLFAAGRIK